MDLKQGRAESKASSRGNFGDGKGEVLGLDKGSSNKKKSHDCVSGTTLRKGSALLTVNAVLSPIKK